MRLTAIEVRAVAQIASKWPNSTFELSRDRKGVLSVRCRTTADTWEYVVSAAGVICLTGAHPQRVRCRQPTG